MSSKLPKKAKVGQRRAPYAYVGLDRIFHERGRLAVCTCLMANAEGLTFTELLHACGLTDGNLNRHLAVLSDMGVISVAKETRSGRPSTTYRITKSGRTRFLAYIDELEAVVRTVHDRAEQPRLERRAAPRLATT